MNKGLASCLAREIELYADRLRQTHPLVQLARSGQFGPAGVADYLASTRFMVEYTQRHLQAAQCRALELEQSELAAFLARKRREETGHEFWASDDLTLLASLFGDAEPRISPFASDLMHELDRIILVQPACYLAYALFAEYLTVLLGPLWVSILESCCGIPSAAMSVITRHVELDRAHVGDELRDLDALVGQDSPTPYFDTLYKSMRLFDRYLDDLFERHRVIPQLEPAAAE